MSEWRSSDLEMIAHLKSRHKRHLIILLSEYCGQAGLRTLVNLFKFIYQYYSLYNTYPKPSSTNISISYQTLCGEIFIVYTLNCRHVERPLKLCNKVSTLNWPFVLIFPVPTIKPFTQFHNETISCQNCATGQLAGWVYKLQCPCVCVCAIAPIGDVQVI